MSTRLLAVLLAAWMLPALPQLRPVSSTSDWTAVTRMLAARRYREALQVSERLLAADPQDARAWTIKGMALAGLRQSRLSLAAFRHALELQSNYLPALEGAAQIEYDAGDPHTRASLETILSLQPANATAHAMLGVLAFERKDCRSAVAHFERAEDQVRRDPRALWQFGQCLVTLDEPERAAVAFEVLLALEPDDKARYNLGLCRFLKGDYRGAIGMLGPLAAGVKVEADTMKLLAAAYEGDHQTDAAAKALQRAVDALRKAIVAAPQHPANYLDLAALCLDRGNYELGLEIVDAGLRQIPGSAALYAERGILYAQIGRFEQAEADFEQANRLDPAQLYGTAGISIAMLQAGQTMDSVKVLRERLAASKSDYALNYLLAEALLRTGIEPGSPDFEEARSALSRSINAKPDFAMAHAKLGKLYLMTADLENALKECRLAVKLAPNDGTAIYHLMLALRQASRNEEATLMAKQLRALRQQELRNEVRKNRLSLVKAAPPRAGIATNGAGEETR